MVRRRNSSKAQISNSKSQVGKRKSKIENRDLPLSEQSEEAGFQSPVRNPKSKIESRTLRTLHSALRIVKGNVPRSHEYAYYPAFSWDGRTLAYSWYRGPYWVELRTVSLVDGTVRVVYSKPGLILNPHDWTPDGRTIVCETLNLERETFKWLGLVDVESGELHEPLPLWGPGRGLKVSPDGRYVAYDLAERGHANIYVFDLRSREQSKTLFNVSGYLAGWDAPVWSADGTLLLARNQGNFELWAQQVRAGRPTEETYLVQRDLPRALLALSGADHAALPEFYEPPMEASAGEALSFFEEFDGAQLDSAWSLFQWPGSNIYGYRHLGRISLTDHPGYLRYYVDPMTSGTSRGYRPRFSGYYWFYPALELRRALAGRRWTLQARVTYSMVEGANGRDLELGVVFGEARRRAVLRITNNRDIVPQERGLSVAFHVGPWNVPLSGTETAYRSPADTSGLAPFTYVWRISRRDSVLSVEISDDEGGHFQPLFTTTLKREWRTQPQALILTGGSWFVPAGTYADWDYIRFQVLNR